MIIPEEYYTKEIEIKLTAQEIETIINELESMPHNIFEFMNTQKIINKLRLQELKGEIK